MSRKVMGTVFGALLLVAGVLLLLETVGVLIAAGLLDKLFAELDRQLEKAGVVLKRGTMLDATLMETQAARPPRDGAEPVDPDARLTSRKGKPGVTYGYKAHVGVDEGSGLIRTVITTPANINDTTPADQLVRGDDHPGQLRTRLQSSSTPYADLLARRAELSGRIGPISVEIGAGCRDLRFKSRAWNAD